ncbi:MAG: hypothetical protein ACRC9R_11625, partial [Enterovibrio sp.]
MMTIGNAGSRFMNPTGQVNNGDIFKEYRWGSQSCLYPTQSRTITLTIAGQIFNVRERMCTISYETSAGPIFNMQRTLRVQTLNNVPLRNVTQSDIISAIREHNAQTRQQTQATQQAQTNQQTQTSQQTQ